MHLFYIPFALLISAASFPLWVVFVIPNYILLSLWESDMSSSGYKLDQALECWQYKFSLVVMLLQDCLPSILYIMVLSCITTITAIFNVS